MKNLIISTEELQKTKRIERTVRNYRCEAVEDAVLQQDLTVSFALELIGGEILMNGEVTGTVTMECCRCLESYAQPVQLPIAQAYRAETAEIDVEKEVREQVILNMPVKPLCRTDCAGLCTQCGTNRNKDRCSCTPGIEQRDLRWDKLKEVIKKPK
jgi:uncharacterized protein